MSDERSGPDVATVAPAVAILVVLIAIATPPAVRAAAPDVREVSPAEIVIDGRRVDWDTPALDFLAPMYQAGKPDKPVLSRLYGRYDCADETFYVLVETVSGWVIIPSGSDNFVKIGNSTSSLTATRATTGPRPTSATSTRPVGRRHSTCRREVTVARTA